MFMGKAYGVAESLIKTIHKNARCVQNKSYTHGIINYLDTRAKCPHLKN